MILLVLRPLLLKVPNGQDYAWDNRIWRGTMTDGLDFEGEWIFAKLLGKIW